VNCFLKVKLDYRNCGRKQSELQMLAIELTANEKAHYQGVCGPCHGSFSAGAFSFIRQQHLVNIKSYQTRQRGLTRRLGTSSPDPTIEMEPWPPRTTISIRP
jgi:hypothetical protein